MCAEDAQVTLGSKRERYEPSEPKTNDQLFAKKNLDNREVENGVPTCLGCRNLYCSSMPCNTVF